MRLFIIFAISLITFSSQHSMGQVITEKQCVKEQKRTAKMRDSIIRTYTRGKKAVSPATAGRMATNIEIAVARQCASAIRRNLNEAQFQKEGQTFIITVARNSVHDEHFDLTDSTIVEKFFKEQSAWFYKAVK